MTELLSIPGGVRYPALDAAPQRKKELTLRLSRRQLEGWPGSSRCLSYSRMRIGAMLPRAISSTASSIKSALCPFCFLVTYRPELQSVWMGQPYSGKGCGAPPGKGT